MLKAFEEELKANLSNKRFEHCKNVAKAAKELANYYNLDEKKAYTAGLLHDITKELPEKTQLEMIKKYNLKQDLVFISSPKLWHAKTGAAYVKDKLNVNDQDLLSAISYHTTGKARMTKFEKIVYIADLISDDRTYDDVDVVRKLAYENINKCVLYILKYIIGDLICKNSLICMDTVEAYNYYYLKIKNSKQEAN